MRLLPLLLLAALPSACGESTAPSGTIRVLFVGNSLTSYNDLPSMVVALGAYGGVRVEVGEALQPGTNLEDQWILGPGRDLLDEGGWDFVVLQQGPSSLPASRENLLQWTAVWDEAIRAEGAVTALYAVWPEEARANVFPDVSANYRAAAELVDGVFLPAGDAWLAAWAEDPDLELYGPDRFHPSAVGSLLAAITIYAGLTGVMPEVPAELVAGHPVVITPALADLLERAAATALAAR